MIVTFLDCDGTLSELPRARGPRLLATRIKIMGDKAKIAWTEASWNVIVGCSRISAGCKNCYAIGMANRLGSNPATPQYKGLTTQKSGNIDWAGETHFVEKLLNKPKEWTRSRRIFVCSMADLFHETVKDEWLDQIFHVIADCPHHVFQVLTKRDERMVEYLSSSRFQKIVSDAGYTSYLPNLWLGVTVEDPTSAVKRPANLLKTDAAIRFISCEPLLSEVNLAPYFGRRFECRVCGFNHIEAGRGAYKQEKYCGLCAGDCGEDVRLKLYGRGIDWVIVGGESGPNARPMDLEWARKILSECKKAGVKFFFKQTGSMYASEHDLEHKKGENPAEWPDDINIQQYPVE